ncbi:hypothetical protein [Symmachiella dynata]|nr:hypothetical protein [Symmachiella dynata]
MEVLMIIGPDEVIACPRCRELAKYQSLISGNTFGAICFSDGKQIAPMLPSPPAVVNCSQCGKCYWLKDALVVGTVESPTDEIDPNWTQAPMIEEPTAEQYYQAIGDGLAQNISEERKLRILAWWRDNDYDRGGEAEDEIQRRPPSSLRNKNLEALIRLASTDTDDEKLLKAEMYRELGDIESAKQLLDQVEASELAYVVDEIRKMCENGETKVRMLLP